MRSSPSTETATPRRRWPGEQPRRGGERRIGQGALGRGKPKLGRNALELAVGLVEVGAGRIGEPGVGSSAPDDGHGAARRFNLGVVHPGTRERERRGPQPGLSKDRDQRVERRPGEERPVHHQELSLGRFRKVRRKGPRSRHPAHCAAQAIRGPGQEPRTGVDGTPQVDDAGHRPTTAGLRRQRPPGPR